MAGFYDQSRKQINPEFQTSSDDDSSLPQTPDNDSSDDDSSDDDSSDDDEE